MNRIKIIYNEINREFIKIYKMRNNKKSRKSKIKTNRFEDLLAISKKLMIIFLKIKFKIQKYNSKKKC